jgi:pimeloyl-ACP methyl ester carboxylesterase
MQFSSLARFGSMRRGVLAIIFALVVASCGSSDNTVEFDSTDSVFNPGYQLDSISWGACVGEDAPESPFECASFDVPLRHGEVLEDEVITLALVRLPAEDESRGVILTNPGGPGGSGFDFLVNAGESLVQSLDLGGYDLIGFDPRGVDRSGGLRCLSDEQMDKYLYVDSTPDTPEEQKLYDESEDIFETECQKKYGDTMLQYSTLDTAKDMNYIRMALDQDVIHYIGISYGTYLGGVFATQFPDHVGSMFLDAPFDPQGDTVEESYLTQITGFEESFNAWVSWCESTSDCAFRSNDVGARWDALLEQLDQQSIVVANGREVNNAAMESATVQALYSRSSWPLLATALAQAEQGVGEPVLRLADAYNGRNEDGTFSTIEQSGRIIRCASSFGRDAPDDPQALVDQLRKQAPRFSKDITVDDFEDNTCSGLTDGKGLSLINYTGDSPIVVVGGEKDPATPIRWAEEMATNLGSNARLVRFTGEGHSQLLTSSCVDEIARELFSAGQNLPDNDTFCDPDPPIAEPSWWDEVPALTDDEIVLDQAVMGPAVGLPDTDVFAEYRAVRGSAARAFVDYTARLKAAGFEAGDPNATEAVEAPQFFYKGDDVLAFLIIEEAELKDGALVQPSGPVPPERLLVILAYVPG